MFPNPEEDFLPPNVMAGLLIGLVFAFGGLVTWVFKTLVMDSTISFEVYNVLSLNFYSLLGMACLAAILLSHFFVTQRVIHYLDRAQIKFIYILLFSLLSAGIFGLFAIGSLFFETITFAGPCGAWRLSSIFGYYVQASAAAGYPGYIVCCLLLPAVHLPD